MEHSLSQKRLEDYIRNVAQLHKDVVNATISQVEAATRLSALKEEQARLIESGMFPLTTQFYISPKSPTAARKISPLRLGDGKHELMFGCQCKRCVSFSTITMQDRDVLRTMGVVWSKIEIEIEES